MDRLNAGLQRKRPDVIEKLPVKEKSFATALSRLASDQRTIAWTSPTGKSSPIHFLHEVSRTCVAADFGKLYWGFSRRLRWLLWLPRGRAARRSRSAQKPPTSQARSTKTATSTM